MSLSEQTQNMCLSAQTQNMCLRWNNHQTNFIAMSSALLNQRHLVDVTLGAEGRQIGAHKIVLAACSSYFQDLFTQSKNPHPIIILKDVKYQDLEVMIHFMYYGVVNVSQSRLPQVLKMAETLKIRGLGKVPVHHESSADELPSSSSSVVTEFKPPGFGSPSIPRRYRRKTNTHPEQRKMCMQALQAKQGKLEETDWKDLTQKLNNFEPRLEWRQWRQRFRAMKFRSSQENEKIPEKNDESDNESIDEGNLNFLMEIDLPSLTREFCIDLGA